MTTDKRTVKIEVNLSDDEAWMLAQLCKRLGYHGCKEHCAPYEEPYTMLYATDMVAIALRAAGYDPR